MSFIIDLLFKWIRKLDILGNKDGVVGSFWVEVVFRFGDVIFWFKSREWYWINCY